MGPHAELLCPESGCGNAGPGGKREFRAVQSCPWDLSCDFPQLQVPGTHRSPRPKAPCSRPWNRPSPRPAPRPWTPTPTLTPFFTSGADPDAEPNHAREVGPNPKTWIQTVTMTLTLTPDCKADDPTADTDPHPDTDPYPKPGREPNRKADFPRDPHTDSLVRGLPCDPEGLSPSPGRHAPLCSGCSSLWAVWGSASARTGFPALPGGPVSPVLRVRHKRCFMVLRVPSASRGSDRGGPAPLLPGTPAVRVVVAAPCAAGFPGEDPSSSISFLAGAGPMAVFQEEAGCPTPGM